MYYWKHVFSFALSEKVFYLLFKYNLTSIVKIKITYYFSFIFVVGIVPYKYKKFTVIFTNVSKYLILRSC